MGKYIAVLFCLSLTACADAEKQETKQKAILHFNIGVSDLESGRYPEALQQLLIANDMEPDNPLILNNLGLAYFVREKYAEAHQNIARALKLRPSYSDARNNLGRVLIEMGRTDDAIAELERVTKDLTYPSPEKAFANLGLAHMKKEEYQKAKKALAKAIQINREFCEAYNYYGQTLFRNQEFSKSSDIFDRALKICDRIPQEVHYFSALSYYKSGQFDKAIARFEEVIKNYPESEFAQKSESMLKIIKK